MSFFRMIIPNNNSADWITTGLNSILNQTFTDWELLIVDDASYDSSPTMIQNIINANPTRNIRMIRLEKKGGYPGNTRNVALKESTDAPYTLFMDSDDWLCDNYAFQNIYRAIEKHNRPDVVRLPYIMWHGGAYQQTDRLFDTCPAEMAQSYVVAPWTKAIKTELIVPFPEGTLFEDIVQHLYQTDVVETVCHLDMPIVRWNRSPQNTVSLTANLTKNEDYIRKYHASCFKICADLTDFVPKHDYLKDPRQRWLDFGTAKLRELKLV